MSAAEFQETGLAEPLAAAAAALGFDRPTSLQRAAIPVLRRGANAILRGSTGAGSTLAWAAPMLERVVDDLGGSDAPQALVLTHDAERAGALADSVAQYAGAAAGEAGARWRSLRVRALAPGWSPDQADVLFASVTDAANAVSESRLKLGGVGILVIEAVTTVLEATPAEMLETLLAAAPRDGQRVFVTSETHPDVERLAEAHARRALNIPTRATEEFAAEPDRTLAYIVTGATDKLETLCALLSRREAARDVVLTRTNAGAEALRAVLARRGFGEDAGGPAVAPYTGEDRGTIAYDVPFDESGLGRLAGERPVVLIEPAERAHLQAIARQANVRLEVEPQSAARDALASYRRRIAKAIADEDVEAQIAILAPLFERHAAEEVAAALSALLRKKAPPPPEPAAKPAVPEQPTYVRLFISVGQRDGVRPADLVGAIAGEAGLRGDRVGRVDIRDTFSVAEVEADVAESVIRALNGTTIRGRSVRVDYDRRSTPGAVRRSRAPRPGSERSSK